MLVRLALLLPGILLAACGGGAAAGAFTPAAMPQGGNWTGLYFSDWGRMELQRTGDTVVGTFRSDIKHGRLSGNVNGNVLRFSWTQLDERIGGRTRTLEGSGQFRYVVDDNGEHHLEGTWGYGANISGAGVWNAARSRSRVRPGGTQSDQGEGDEGGEEGGSDTNGDTGNVTSGGSTEPAAGGSSDSLDDL